jgi:integral membrane protein
MGRTEVVQLPGALGGVRIGGFVGLEGTKVELIRNLGSGSPPVLVDRPDVGERTRQRLVAGTTLGTGWPCPTRCLAKSSALPLRLFYARQRRNMIPVPIPSDPPGTRVVPRALLVQYRFMAFTTATLLIILVFVGVPLQLAAGRPGVVSVVGTMHGFLYIVYIVVAFRLTHKLRIPKWQMALVLLAGTVPFCAFVAERKMSRRFGATFTGVAPRADGTGPSDRSRGVSARKRWFSRRALLLHLEVVVVTPACAIAGWWQATRALGGNELSWVYSVEWPIFALLAIWGWWHLIHEDPEVYKLRKARLVDGESDSVRASDSLTAPRTRLEPALDRATMQLTRILVVLVGLEFLLGVASMAVVPFSRPSGWIPNKNEAVYLAHADLGALVLFLAVVLVLRLRTSARTGRLVGGLGLAGLMLAGAGGLLTDEQSIARFLGMCLMLVGTAFAVFAYMIPKLLRTREESLSQGISDRP